MSKTLTDAYLEAIRNKIAVFLSAHGLSKTFLNSQTSSKATNRLEAGSIEVGTIRRIEEFMASYKAPKKGKRS